MTKRSTGSTPRLQLVRALSITITSFGFLACAPESALDGTEGTVQSALAAADTQASTETSRDVRGAPETIAQLDDTTNGVSLAQAAARPVPPDQSIALAIEALTECVPGELIVECCVRTSFHSAACDSVPNPELVGC